ncbi:YidC/Oxa1 family membrane protein insertase [uncultured Brachyspira sp.]|uniref:YidC/Oxa1 family membrane protein insertase n=1 Tax=uncultured Brachyspira sp. TaxID=221953 RepID=UPI00259B1226|nr:YidC/Oxa1 family membrane protein insertase [uncultured Brachyspira sp.]
MILFDILYNITIYPIEFIIEIVFYLFNNVFKSGYATSLFFLSLIINFISLPLYNIAESWQAKERAIQEKMKPMIDNIKAVYKGDQRYLLIRTCQRINGYKTIYAFRGTLGLLIQIPFFLAAYNFIHNLSGLQLGSFLFIKDFSKPDAAINIGNITINILPFVMTLFSLLSGLVYSKKLKFKESLPLYIVSLIFLILLYNSPSGLVFYWTLNCLFSLIKNIFIEYKLYKTLVYKIKNKFDKKENFNNIYKIFICLSLYIIIIASIFDNTNNINNSNNNINNANNIVINKYFLVIFGILALLSILLNIQFISFIKNKVLASKTLKNIINILTIIITIAFVSLSVLGNVERKGYLGIGGLIWDREATYNYNMRVSYYDKTFRNNDIYGVIVNTNKLDSNIFSIEFEKYGSPFGIVKLNDDIKNIEKIEVYYKLFVKSIFLAIFILFITLFILFNNIYKYIFNIFNNIISDSFLEKRNLLIISSCLVISVLSGLFISSSLIGNSPTEFKNPFDLIVNDFSMSLGLFLFYPLFIYILFSENIKNYLTLLLIFLASFVLVNTFIMKGNYININANFVFDNTDLLKASLKEILLTIILTVILISIIILILKKNKAIFLINIYSIVLLVLVSISIFDISKIIKEHNKLKNIQVDNKSSDIKIFNMSKTGENVFIFVLDRAINSYWLDAFERFPNYKKDFDGFIFYPNNVSFSDFTVTAASLYGGYDYLPYEMSIDGGYNITNFHNEALLTIPLTLEKYGYKSTMLHLPYANFQAYSDLSIFKNYTNINAYDNNSIYEYSINKYLNIQTNDYANNNSFNKKIMRFSIFRMLPINLRYDFYDDKGWFNPNLNINSSIFTYAMLNYTKDFININENGNYYNVIHNDITHEPFYFSSDFLPHMELKGVDKKYLDIYKDNFSVIHFYANVASINCITNFITYLKENDIYDNTKIIIVSDHGRSVNTKIFDKDMGFANWYNALLMYKDFNSKGEIKIDTNFMTIADTPYLATKHIPNIQNPFNNKLITNDYKTNGAYIINFSGATWVIDNQFSNAYNINYYYHVKDNIFDINNWKKFQIDWKTKEKIEVELK